MTKRDSKLINLLPKSVERIKNSADNQSGLLLNPFKFYKLMSKEFLLPS